MNACMACFACSIFIERAAETPGWTDLTSHHRTDMSGSNGYRKATDVTGVDRCREVQSRSSPNAGYVCVWRGPLEANEANARQTQQGSG